jgi:hypothetical protein
VWTPHEKRVSAVPFGTHTTVRGVLQLAEKRPGKNYSNYGLYHPVLRRWLPMEQTLLSLAITHQDWLELRDKNSFAVMTSAASPPTHSNLVENTKEDEEDFIQLVVRHSDTGKFASLIINPSEERVASVIRKTFKYVRDDSPTSPSGSQFPNQMGSSLHSFFEPLLRYAAHYPLTYHTHACRLMPPGGQGSDQPVHRVFLSRGHQRRKGVPQRS